MRKLILKNGMAPGDIVMLTAAVRDLHACYPGQFLTDARTSCMEIWENNPYLTALREGDPRVEVLDCRYPLINQSNAVPYHCLHGFISFLNERLGLSIKPTVFRGDIHLSPQEKAWFSQIHELAGADIPFWIVAAGGKYDITIKWWSSERYQKVIDHFRGRIQFVQIGAQGHYHPKLRGTIDLRGKTSLRELIRLVYHSQGVLCGVTAAMHLAAAVETKPLEASAIAGSRRRPCVVVAGAREPAHWEAYPDHQFLSTNGTLPCAGEGGCWRGRTVALGDGDKRDRPTNLCLNVVDQLPRCMDMITPERVIESIELYFSGATCSYLTARQQKRAQRAMRANAKNPFDESALTVHNARIALEKYIRKIPPPPHRFDGRGIVICAGGVRCFTNAWVCINILRQVGCALPIQVWHLGPAEMDREMAKLLEPLAVTCVDAQEVAKKFPARRLGGWELKAFAICYSHFREVLLLDADNVPVIDPEFLFDTEQYRETGAIFWPDFPSSKKANAAWKSCGIERPDLSEFESGQIVVDKERCWEPMRLALWFNDHSDFYYKHVHGDKETFHLAFHKLERDYAFVPTPIYRLEATMCQHDFKGRRIFQHRNMDKWNLFLRNRRIADFHLEEDCFQYLRELRNRWDGRVAKFTKPLVNSTNRGGLANVVIHACMISCEARRSVRQRTLTNLRAMDWGDLPVSVEMDSSASERPEERQTETARNALEGAARSGAEYILFLEDDLIFNRHILHNLLSWGPLIRREIALASLYNPGVPALAWGATENFTLALNEHCFGSQAFLISRDAVRHILNRWHTVEGMQDIKISRLAAQIQSPMYYHTPSLAQHVGKRSVWGGGFHQARDFDPEWKREVLKETNVLV
jgi:hypothetical protein